MRLRHPFEWLTPSGQFRAFILFFILSILAMVGLQVTGAHLINQVSPSGILSFEFVPIRSFRLSGQVYYTS